MGTHHLTNTLFSEFPISVLFVVTFKMVYTTLVFLVSLSLPASILSLRCYSDHSGPNSAGGIEVCDDGGVCSSSRILFRESGVLRTAMSCHCKEELCNQNSLLLPKFNEWISVTRA